MLTAARDLVSARAGRLWLLHPEHGARHFELAAAIGQDAPAAGVPLNSHDDATAIVEAGDPLMVSLGTADYRNRWIRYIQLRPQIQQQYPEAVRVDLRFKNQVIVRMRDDETGEKLTWDVHKKSL